jgi:hypothetical protein
MQISQLIALNCAYWESLPELYTNNKVEMLVNARCSGTKHWDTCSGPARVLFKVRLHILFLIFSLVDNVHIQSISFCLQIFIFTVTQLTSIADLTDF